MKRMFSIEVLLLFSFVFRIFGFVWTMIMRLEWQDWNVSLEKVIFRKRHYFVLERLSLCSWFLSQGRRWSLMWIQSSLILNLSFDYTFESIACLVCEGSVRVSCFTFASCWSSKRKTQWPLIPGFALLWGLWWWWDIEYWKRSLNPKCFVRRPFEEKLGKTLGPKIEFSR
jgi:hypothetical protein